MKKPLPLTMLAAVALGVAAPPPAAAADDAKAAPVPDLRRIAYNDPGLVVDLGVGLWAWPLPMDFDRDGDLDLVVSCPDKPYNGIYFFENPGGGGGGKRHPVFKPGVRLAPARRNLQVSYVGGEARVLFPRHECVDFRDNAFAQTVQLYPRSVATKGGRVRADQWKYADYDGDGDQDLIVGTGEWGDYGWDDAYDGRGRWTNGPLRGFVRLLENEGSDAAPRYADPRKLTTEAGAAVEVFGMPSPNLADFDRDGDLDLLCGEFLDGFTYFQNTGTRAAPRYAAGRRLPVRMDLQMITPTSVDWDGDGDVDLVVGDEDGRVALVEHTGVVGDDGIPVFLPPVYFRQEAADVKFGALATPHGCDWDGDGDEDLICGNTAGYIAWIENRSGPGVAEPRWAPPRLLRADGQVIRLQAGPNGSIQGPCEAKWGYTTQTVADWDGDGLLDIVANSIWGKVIWFQNVGSRTAPVLTSARPVRVEWPGGGAPPKPSWFWWSPQDGELATQWRTTPVATDWDGDGLCDLVMLDHEGYLALYQRAERDGRRILLPPRRAFVDEDGEPLRLNPKRAGGSGRRKLAAADWDGDGRTDLLLNSVNADWLRNLGPRAGGLTAFKNEGPVGKRRLAGHTSSPTTVDWDGDGVRDLLVGAEDGFLYFMRNPGKGKGK